MTQYQKRAGTAEVTSSPFPFIDSGIEVYAALDWDETSYLLWFEMACPIEDYAEFDVDEIYKKTEQAIEKIGVCRLSYLDGVNSKIYNLNSDKDWEHGFRYDEIIDNIVGY